MVDNEVYALKSYVKTGAHIPCHCSLLACVYTKSFDQLVNYFLVTKNRLKIQFWKICRS